jgi:hypothetical protein
VKNGIEKVQIGMARDGVKISSKFLQKMEEPFIRDRWVNMTSLEGSSGEGGTGRRVVTGWGVLLYQIPQTF